MACNEAIRHCDRATMLPGRPSGPRSSMPARLGTGPPAIGSARSGIRLDRGRDSLCSPRTRRRAPQGTATERGAI